MERRKEWNVKTMEEAQEAVSELRAWLEEIVLSHGSSIVELWTNGHLPQEKEVKRGQPQ